MKSTIIIFRILLILYLLLMISAFIKIVIIGRGELPPEAIRYLQWYAQQSQVHNQIIAYIGSGIAIIFFFSTIALYFLASWSRPIFVLSIIAMIILEALLDYPVLKAPLDYSIDSIVGIVGGLIIALAYWSPIAGEMNGNKT